MSFEWHSLAVMPTKRVYSTPVEVDNKLYVLGGCDEKGTPLNNMEMYDPLTNTWSKLSGMPTKRAGCSAVSVENKIIAVGGVNTSQTPVDVVEVYDCVKKLWTTASSLPEKLLGLSTVVRNGHVFVVGGSGVDTNPKDYLLDYDVTCNKWTTLPSMPTPRYATFTFLINDKLYVIGGRQGKIAIKSFEMYDFNTSKWTKLPDVPSGRVFALYAHCNGLIHSVGGLLDSKQGFTDVSQIFDIEKGEWRVSEPMVAKRGDFAAGVVGDKLIVAGGLGNQGAPLKQAEAYDVSSHSWNSIPELPTAHSSCAFINFHNSLYLIGGLSVGGPTRNVAALSFKS